MQVQKTNSDLNEILKLILEKEEEMEYITEFVDVKLKKLDAIIDDVNIFLNTLKSDTKNILENVKKGDSGKDGEQGLPGKDGYTPKYGNDYLTEKEVNTLIKKVQEKISIPKIETNLIVKEIIEKLDKKPVEIEYKNIKGAPDLTDLPKLIAFLKAGGFRGGGSSTNSSSSFTVLIPTSGVVNGSNTVFTFSKAPNVLVLDNNAGGTYNKTNSDGSANWTGTTTITLLVQAPNYNLYGF